MNRKILIVAAITLLLDQLAKVAVSTLIPLNGEFVLINNFFSIHYINNYGAAWSILTNQTTFIIILSIISLIIIYHLMFVFQKNKRNNIAFGLLVGGLVGNLIDRWLFGYVRDFFDFRIFHYDYPVFNIADMSIVIGVILLLYAVIKGEDQRGNIDSNEK